MPAASRRYAAFLGSINVGGRRITNDALRIPFEALGLSDVATYRASGNVVFGAPKAPGDELRDRIETALAEALGYEVLVFLRTAAALRALSAYEPFTPGELAATAGRVQIGLLRATPDPGAADAVTGSATGPDRLVLEGDALFWLPAGGISDSPLDLAALARLLGPMTVRTKGTIDAIAKRC